MQKQYKMFTFSV